MIIRAVDQDAAHAHVAHLCEQVRHIIPGDVPAEAAARRKGMTVEAFNVALPDLIARGFPKPDQATSTLMQSMRGAGLAMPTFSAAARSSALAMRRR